MFGISALVERLFFLLGGFFLALLILSMLILPSGKFTALDIWRFFLSPGIVGLIAAMFGAWAGARSNIKVSQSDLAQTYLSLLDLVKEDIRVNMRLMLKVREKIDIIAGQNRKPKFGELEPESVHTMFFEDIEYHKLRKLLLNESVSDIFNVRNVTYVFNRWNHLVDKYYLNENPVFHEEGQEELIEHLTTCSESGNFITACKNALDSIDVMQGRITRQAAKKI